MENNIIITARLILHLRKEMDAELVDLILKYYGDLSDKYRKTIL